MLQKEGGIHLKNEKGTISEENRQNKSKQKKGKITQAYRLHEEGVSVKEIAEKMNFSERTVRSYVWRALRDAATSILAKMNSALLELDDFRDRVINKEAYAARLSYHKVMAKVHSKIRQYVSNQNKDKRPVVIDAELQKELDGCIPSLVNDKTRLSDNVDFALVATRGPSFIDEYSLRPENYLLDMIQAVETWDEDGIDSIIKQLAMNKYVDQEVIERLEKWDIKDRSISNFDWQKIKKRLADIPKIREEIKKEKERFIQSSNFKRVVRLKERASLIVTKEMIGKRKLNEIKRELSGLSNAKRTLNARQNPVMWFESKGAE